MMEFEDDDSDLDADVAILTIMLDDMDESEEEAKALQESRGPKERPLNNTRKNRRASPSLVSRQFKDNDTKFQEQVRLSPYLFDCVLNAIKFDIASIQTNTNPNPIMEKEKLYLTLRYLSTGESFRSLALQYRIHVSWISRIIHSCLKAIVKNLFIPKPNEARFKKIAEDFFIRWDYPNCIGVLDGKYVRVKWPPKSLSVLLAIVDANYKFIAVDIGLYGQESDDSIFTKSEFNKQIKNGTFGIPPPATLPNTAIEVPHVLLGNEAFPLHPNLMKSFPTNEATTDKRKLVYNIRHNHARRTTDNAFGIFAAYFKVFSSPIAVKADRVHNVIAAACILHNLLRDAKIPASIESHNDSRNFQLLPEANLQPIAVTSERNIGNASMIRDQFKAYFNGPGEVLWQREQISQDF